MIKEDTVTRLLDNESEGGELTRKAVTLLAEAAAVQGTLHLPGVSTLTSYAGFLAAVSTS